MKLNPFTRLHFGQSFRQIFLSGIILLPLLLLSTAMFAQFSKVSTPFPQLRFSPLAWGDYDNDGDLDVYIKGFGNDNSTSYSALYRNDGNASWTLIPTGIPVSAFGSSMWIDYDNDGDLDLTISGTFTINSSHVSATHIYRNDGNDTFTKAADLKASNIFSWGDSDNDGDYDLVVIDGFYRNDNGTMTEVPLADLGLSSVKSPKFVDYDNDGWLDIFTTSTGSAKMYKNKGNDTFEEVDVSIPDFHFTYLEFADYNNDGFVDLIATRSISTEQKELLAFRNTGNGTFAERVILSNISGPVALGDYDNDGDLDILIAGNITNTSSSTKVLRNNGISGFSAISLSLDAAYSGYATWADYNNDGKLDMLYSGNTGDLYGGIFLYRNEATSTNSTPGAVSNLQISSYRSAIKVTWTAATDIDGGTLTYNTSVGTTSGGIDIQSPMADLSTGLRRVPAAGNSGITRSAKFNMPDGTYYFQVQAIDNSYAGGRFASSASFAWTAPLPPPAELIIAEEADQKVELEWPQVNQADFSHYRLYRETTPATDPANIIFESQAGNPADTLYTDLGMANDITYYYYLASIRQGDLEGELAEAEARPFDITLVPLSQPGNLQATSTYNSVMLTWESNEQDNFSHYRIYRETAETESPSNMIYETEMGNRTQTTFTDTDLPQEVEYVYYVVTVNQRGVISTPSPVTGAAHLLAPMTLNITSTGTQSRSAFADFNNDGKLDAVILNTTTGTLGSAVFRNIDGVLSRQFSFPNLRNASIACADYDNDVDIDLLVCGTTESNTNLTNLYRNTGTTFGLVTSGLPANSHGTAIWADFDNDGDQDLLLSGRSAPGNFETHTRIYYNDNGTFSNGNVEFPVLRTATVAATGDYDNDGDIDIFLSGSTPDGIKGFLLRNDANAFREVSSDLHGLTYGSAEFADYDKDGDLDLLVSGHQQTILYDNNNGTMTASGHELPALSSSAVAWADYNNDGNPDFLLTGIYSSEYHTRLFSYADGSFTETPLLATEMSYGSISWGDFNGDNKADLITSGSTSATTSATRLYINLTPEANILPEAPANLSFEQKGQAVILQWDAPADMENSQLSYNVRFGTDPEGTNLCQGMTLTSGQQLVPNRGNAGISTGSFFITVTEPGTYYWSVQAIDGAYGAGPYSEVNTISITTFPSSVSGLQAEAGHKSVTLSWNETEDISFSHYNIYRETEFKNIPVNLVDSTTQGDVSDTTFTETNLSNFTEYFYYVSTVNTNGVESTPVYVTVIPVQFTETAINIQGIDKGVSTWGDYDNDGDLDLLLSGSAMGSPAFSIYRNDNGSFTDINAHIDPLSYSAAAWGDYDNDGDLDLAISGINQTEEYFTGIYRNNDGEFEWMMQYYLGEVAGGDLAWGDMNNDGTLDLLVTGYGPSDSRHTAIYENKEGKFLDIQAQALYKVGMSSADWGDFDNDGDLDLLLGGNIQLSQFGMPTNVVSIFRNEGNNTFQVIRNFNESIMEGTVAWVDYNNDGALDVFFHGYNLDETEATLYLNEANQFTKKALGIPNITNGEAAWADFNNDGRPDLLMSGGYTPDTKTALYYQDVSGNLREAPVNLPQYSEASVAWADFNNDNKIDFIVTGSKPGNNEAKIFQNHGDANSAPAAPASLRFTPEADKVTLQWDEASDPDGGSLTYNIRIGTQPGKSDVISAMVVPQSHLRNIVQRGNAGNGTTFIINNLPVGTYYWSVQAIDQGFVPGLWSNELEMVNEITVLTSPIENRSGKPGEQITIDLKNHFTGTNVNETMTYSVSFSPVGSITISEQDLEEGVLIYTVNESVPVEIIVTATTSNGAAYNLTFVNDGVTGTVY